MNDYKITICDNNHNSNNIACYVRKVFIDCVYPILKPVVENEHIELIRSLIKN